MTAAVHMLYFLVKDPWRTIENNVNRKNKSVYVWALQEKEEFLNNHKTYICVPIYAMI